MNKPTNLATREAAVRGALSALRTALRLCHEAQATRTAIKVRLAVSSCEGALRHARLKHQHEPPPAVSPDDYIHYARERHAHDGELEIEDNALISRVDTGRDDLAGAYVQAWVWVYNIHINREAS